jgi:hypothetical protein
MTMPTLERAYKLARTGRFASVESLKARLRADGCRAVDVLLAPRQICGHLAAICAATYQPRSPASHGSDGSTPEAK